MTTATATITGTITVPSQAKAARVTVKFAPYTENLRLVHPDGVVEGWELVTIDPAAGTWSIDLPLTGQAGVSPAGALWQAQERATNGAIETTVFDLTGDIDWGDIVPVADLPVTPSVLQEAVAARDAALAAEAAAQAAATAAEAVGALADSQIAGKVSDTSPSATRAALAAGFASQSVALMTELGGRSVFHDDFNRPDQIIATQGDGTVSPTGQLYKTTGGQGVNPQITGHKVTYTNETYSAFYLQGGRELFVTLDQVPDAIGADFFMTSGTTRGQNAVIAACWSLLGTGSVQFAVWPDSWEFFFAIPNTPSAGVTLTSIAAGTFSTPLPLDTGQTYRTIMRLDRSTDTVQCWLNGVMLCEVTDPRIALWWGNVICIQERRESDGDQNNNNLDGHVQWKRWAASSPQPAPAGTSVVGVALPGGNGAHLQPQLPNHFAPSTLQVIVDCDGWGSAPATDMDILGWGHTLLNDYGFRVRRATSGGVRLYISPDGIATNTAQTSPGAVSTSARRVMVTYDAGGNYNAYWNGDATFDPDNPGASTWTKIGTATPTLAGPMHIPARYSAFQVGAFDYNKTTSFVGTMRGAWLYDGITQYLTDVVTTSGSATVTSPGGSFTSAMTGRAVVGVVSGPIQPGTTLTYVSATQATLSKVAAASATAVHVTVGSVAVGSGITQQYLPATWYDNYGNLWSVTGSGWTWASGATNPVSYGTLANLPVTSSDGYIYVATDQNGGTPYQWENGAWVKMAAAVNDPALAIGALFLGELGTPGTTVTNSSTDTVVFTSTTLGAGSLVTGKTSLRLRIGGTLTSIITGGTFTGRVKVNGTTVATLTLAPSQTAAKTGIPWHLDADIYVDATGSGGSVTALGTLASIIAASGTQGDQAFSGTLSKDLSSGLTVTVTVQMATADPGNTIVAQRGICQQVA